MLFKIFENKLANLLGENKLLKLVVIVIGGSVLLMNHKLDAAMKYQRTILVPANLDHRVTITGDHASDDYVKGFARTVATLAFNYDFASVRGQFGELLGYFSSDTFPAAKQAFFSLAETIERTRLSSHFVINKPIEIDNDKQIMTITGVQRQWVESNFVDAAEKSYMVSYKVIDGRFYVTSIDEKTINGKTVAKPGKTATAAPVAGDPTHAK